MQFKQFLHFIFTAAALLLLFPIQSQTLRTNEKKEKIIVYEDGSWQYFADYLSGKDNIQEGTGAPAEHDQSKSYPVFDGYIEPLDGKIAVTQEDIFKISLRRSQLAKEAVKIAVERAAKATEVRASLESEYRKIAQNPNVDEAARHQMEIRLKAARRLEEETAREVREAENVAYETIRLTEKGNYVADHNERQRRRKSQLAIAESRKEMVSMPYESLIPLADPSLEVSPKNNLILHPPQAQCAIAFEGTDQSSGQWRRDVEKQLLFTYTDDRLRLFLKDKEYMRCEGYFTALSGYRFLSLQFTFAYPNAREAYGFIEKGSVLTVKLLNGDFINLQSGEMDQGSYDTEREILTYRVHYPIDRTQINLLKQSEVDAVRVFWSSGFEEYPVYQLDFFINQLRCLEN